MPTGDDLARSMQQEALARHQSGRLDEAVTLYRRCLERAPEDAGVWANLGIALKGLGDLNGALEACGRAAGLDASNANAHNNLGIVQMAMGRPIEATQSYRRALAIDSKFHECWTNVGLAQSALGDPEAATGSFRAALRLKPDHTEALVQFIYHALQICDWRGLDPAIARLARVIRKDSGEVNPFVALAVCRDPIESLRVSQNFARRVERSVSSLRRPMLGRTSESKQRPRIGYLSADFHGHATAYLCAELFEYHDRERFEIFAYSYGPDDQSAMRQRLERAFEHFVDVAPLSVADAAPRIANDGIDILIDLKGYTQNARCGILALRPAPIQLAYLGFPGPMGAGFIDYSLVDEFIAPAGSESFYSEKLIRLPGSYQPNDSTRLIASDRGSRRDHDLPNEGVVFCCFNQAYKITPEAFSVWLRLLKEVPGGVLWLLAFNQSAPRNLRRLARAVGVDPERLVFAARRPLDQHLARLGHADLFLDTWPCNAHTTASDALWAGVPVITLAGRTFAQRVAGSLLTALGLQELITETVEGYYCLARRLALDDLARRDVKARLDTARPERDLFNGHSAAWKLETAFMQLLSEFR
jgi:predicted O-linked N-acetylglucosamine transferase (SPINDLY family)